MTKTHRKQRTISKSVSCTGVGLHTGVESTITFNPAPDNYGIQFSRTDINGSPEIRADKMELKSIQLNMLWQLFQVCG